MQKNDAVGRRYQEIRGFLFFLFGLLLFRSLVFHPFNIPSGSMYPTLMVGDFPIVSKFTYGFSRYSFPFGAIPFPGRIFSNKKPNMGDVIVFRNSKDQSLDYIKRVVGTPGDRIQVRKGVLHINDIPVQLKRIEDYAYTHQDTQKYLVFHQYLETLPNGATHKILKYAPFGAAPLDDTPEYIVPEGHYFMMGDNRDFSQDSRVMDKVGFVPFDHVIGPARFLLMSIDYTLRDLRIFTQGLRLKRFLSVIE